MLNDWSPCCEHKKQALASSHVLPFPSLRRLPQLKTKTQGGVGRQFRGKGKEESSFVKNKMGWSFSFAPPTLFAILWSLRKDFSAVSLGITRDTPRVE